MSVVNLLLHDFNDRDYFVKPGRVIDMAGRMMNAMYGGTIDPLLTDANLSRPRQRADTLGTKLLK